MEREYDVQIENLIFNYNPGKLANQMVLNISDLKIKKGETVFIHGPSGSGKSTLLNLLAGVSEVSSGSLSVLGLNLNTISQPKRDHFRGENIGYIFQIFNLIPYLSIKENIILPCLINSKRAPNINFYQQADDLIKRLGLEQMANKKVTNLSIGQQQRVAAARALIGKPGLVIADEPTSALDEKNTNDFLELLLSEWDKNKFTLVFVSHDLRLGRHFSRIISLPEINKI